MEVKSTQELHTELMMHSVRFAKDEQGRRKGQEILFKWPDIEKKLGEHKHIYVVDARLGSNNHTHRLWYDVIPPHTEEGQEWREGRLEAEAHGERINDVHARNRGEIGAQSRT